MMAHDCLKDFSFLIVTAVENEVQDYSTKKYVYFSEYFVLHYSGQKTVQSKET
jgi:hypothetical protein